MIAVRLVAAAIVFAVESAARASSEAPIETAPDEHDAERAATRASSDDVLTTTRTGFRLDVRLDALERALFDEAPSTEIPPEGRFNIVPMPDLGYNPDEGINTGIVVPMVWSEPGVDPYKYSLGVSFLISTKLVQNHMFMFDLVELFDLPLRLTGRTGLYAFEIEPYCGIGARTTCEDQAAVDAALDRSLDGPERKHFEARYHTMRITRPYASVYARYNFLDWFGKWELVGGWRTEWYIPGFFVDPLSRSDLLTSPIFASGPHEGSLYAKDFPDGEPGLVNVPTLGLMLDTRDFEPSPRRGYWIEATVRGTHPWLLSAWAFAGANVTARFYTSLDSARTLTLAQRYAVDLLVGDAPVQERARMGGTVEYRAFGGKGVGRGMRQQRYIGDLKATSQHELRWDALQVAAGIYSVGVELVSFVDAGVVMAEHLDYTLAPFGLSGMPRVAVTMGVGARLVINRTIIIRFDLGVSPEEAWAPLLYVDGGHVF